MITKKLHETNKRVIKVTGWILFIAVMIIIFILSNQSMDVSYKISDFAASILHIGAPPYQPASSIPVFMGLTIRNFGHITLYAALGVVSFLCVKNFHCRMRYKLIVPMVFCYLFGCMDELHQMFVDGRTASIRDTFINAIGFVPAIIVMFTGYFIIVRRRTKNHEK